MSTQHCGSHLANNNEEQNNNNINKKIGASIPVRLENIIRKNISIGLGLGEAMRSLETSPI